MSRFDSSFLECILTQGSCVDLGPDVTVKRIDRGL